MTRPHRPVIVRWLAVLAPAHPRWRQKARRLARRLGLLPRVRPMLDALERLSERRDDVFFVQIGSNDANHGDPLRQLIRRWRWRGIMVEPVPYIFERLRRGWGAQPGLILENVAIAESDGSKGFYYPRASSDPGLPPWYDQLGSFSLDVVLHPNHLRDIPDLRERIVTASLPCVTFESLCRRHGVERVDLIHIDAEGYDYRILRLIDFARFQPEVVIYEHRHLNAQDRDAALALLGTAGFDCIEDGPDTLAVRPR